MSIVEIKNNFHNLIDNINDAELLKNFYEVLVLSADNSLLKELSEQGKKEILLAYEESEDENNLIDNEVVKENFML
jgi:hypothetical protein